MITRRLSNSLKGILIIIFFFSITNFLLVGCKKKDARLEARTAAGEALMAAYNTWNIADFKKMMVLCKKGDSCSMLVYAALMSAADEQNAKKVSVDVVKFLLDNGAPADASATGQDRTPLASVIVSGGSIGTVGELLKHNARVKNVKLDGSSALHMAVKADREDVAKLLLKLHPELKAIKDKKGHTPLDLARSGKHGRLIALLQPSHSNNENL